MRVTFTMFWTLVIFWLVTADARAQTPSAPPIRVQGYGQTLEKARENAFQLALEQIAQFLPGEDLAFTPSQEEQLKRRWLTQLGKAGPDQEVPPLGVVKSWLLEVPGSEVDHWLQIGQQVQRLRWASQGLAGLLFLLAMGWIYGLVRKA